MKIKEGLCVLMFIVASCLAASAHALEKCSQHAAIAAETQAPAKTWGDLYQTYRRYVQCDDGSVAETFSNSVAQLLAGHWDTIGELSTLAKAHPSFERFVLRHTDVTMSKDQAETIKGNARDKCPDESKGLCGRILHRMSEFK
jgi:hypothetical protein